MKALAVFTDEESPERHWAAPLLKRGFRHVFCVVLNDGYWIRVDACRGIPDVEVVCGGDYDLAGFYRERGYAVVETEQGEKPVHAPMVANNCVGLVKTALCIRSHAVTPWQLYRHLERKNHAATARL